MIGKRHEAIGIKQAIRFEWMQKATNLLLAGLDTKTIRHELHEYLAEIKSSGIKAKRGDTSRTQVVNMLMNIWGSPDSELVHYRNASLMILREHPSMALPVHWGMISAVYPFWFNVARQTGRLLALQDQVTQMQITNRLKEQYGDRQTVSRYTRYVIRSFIAWGILKDSKTKGCYEKPASMHIIQPELAILMLESALLTIPEGKSILNMLLNNPAFFPFQLPVITGGLVSQLSNRIEVVHVGFDDISLSLMPMKSYDS